ncbi:hypothetical protein [Streptomyces sp. NPDC002685]|uniref:hypothetical protein n=1 Tax=Streptomyces sp. NPDC002685 TaxID=3154540 RepID=UPI00332BE74F
MNEAWGAVVAAVAAGVFGIAGILAGILVGRRQTTYQAAVEHGQWLRGQRQLAFSAYLDAWDRALEALEDVAENFNEPTWQRRLGPNRSEEGAAEYVATRLINAYVPTQKLHEQLMLLAPQTMEPLAYSADSTLFGVMNRLSQWTVSEQSQNVIRARIVEYEAAADRAKTARQVLFTAARASLLTPPSPRNP